MIKTLSFSTLLLALTLLATPVRAHKALFYAYIDGGELVCEGGFPGGRLCKKCPVKIFDAASGQEILVGKTNDEGLWRTPLPEAVAKAQYGLKIILTGGEGHQAEWLLEPEEYLTVATPAPAALTPVAKATVKEQAALPKVEAQKPQTTPVTESPDSVVIAGVSSQELTVLMQQAVEQGLDKKLGPLHKQLAHALDPGPSFTSIIGGLGWIIGLAGLLAWMRSRRA